MPIPPTDPKLKKAAPEEEDEELDDEDGDDDEEDADDDDDEDEEGETTAEDVAEDIVEAVRSGCDHHAAVAADGKKVLLDMEDGSKWLITIRSRQ